MDTKSLFQLSRLRPFEGLALTSNDLLDEQAYHRRNLARHALYLHGHGIVQGLQVDLEQRKERYAATIQAGYGITRMGQGVLLSDPATLPLDIPRSDGEYMLWLFHVEAPIRRRPGRCSTPRSVSPLGSGRRSPPACTPARKTTPTPSRSRASTSAWGGWSRCCSRCPAPAVSHARPRATSSPA